MQISERDLGKIQARSERRSVIFDQYSTLLKAEITHRMYDEPEDVYHQNEIEKALLVYAYLKSEGTNFDSLQIPGLK